MPFLKFDQLYYELDEKLKLTDKTLMPDVQKLKISLDLIAKALEEINGGFRAERSLKEADEIRFFKNIRPRFESMRMFAIEQYNIISNVPEDTEESIRQYYIKEIEFIKRFFTQNQFLYAYYKQDESSLDKRYFLRENAQHLFSVDTDALDGTDGGYLFARFIAYEKLKAFLIKRVKLLYQHVESTIAMELLKDTRVKWTDGKVKLVELAYGIYFMGSLNNGKAEISEVVSWLEDSLNIDLGVPYRKFIDISRRKNSSYTQYLDEMRNSIQQHVIENNRYKP